MKKIIIALTVLLLCLVIPTVSAVCTVTFDKYDYAPTEDI